MLNRKIVLVALLLLFNLVSAQSQSDMKYNGEKVNPLDKDGNKIGVWKLFNPRNNVVVEGRVVNDEKLEDITYTMNGVVFAKQHNDSIFDILDKGVLVRLKLQKKSPSDLDTIKANSSKLPLGMYDLCFIREDGTLFDENISNVFFGLARIDAFMYEGLASYLGDNIRKTSTMNGGGMVHIYVILGRNGELTDAKITRSENTSLNAESLRVIKKMPRWQPSFFLGEFNRMSFTIPIVH